MRAAGHAADGEWPSRHMALAAAAVRETRSPGGNSPRGRPGDKARRVAANFESALGDTDQPASAADNLRALSLLATGLQRAARSPKTPLRDSIIPLSLSRRNTKAWIVHPGMDKDFSQLRR